VCKHPGLVEPVSNLCVFRTGNRLETGFHKNLMLSWQGSQRFAKEAEDGAQSRPCDSHWIDTSEGKKVCVEGGAYAVGLLLVFPHLGAGRMMPPNLARRFAQRAGPGAPGRRPARAALGKKLSRAWSRCSAVRVDGDGMPTILLSRNWLRTAFDQILDRALAGQSANKSTPNALLKNRSRRQTPRPRPALWRLMSVEQLKPGTRRKRLTAGIGWTTPEFRFEAHRRYAPARGQAR